MKLRNVLILVGLIIGSYSAFWYATHNSPLSEAIGSILPTAQVQATPPLPTSAELLALTNVERSKAGVAPLVADVRLNTSAQAKSDEMARTGVFEHVAPDGKRGITYITDSGIKCQYQSENLARDAPEPIAGWMTSQNHREAMLDPRYDLVGFANNGIYWTQHFCDLP